VSYYARLIKHKPHGMTDAAFAREILHISKGNLHHWKLIHEAGRMDFLPPKRLIMECAEALKVDPSELMLDDEERKAS